MSKRLIILSDLWGRKKSDWLTSYTKLLETHFDITYYDCCKLGGIDTSVYSEENLHSQFVQGGIDRAVEKLIELEQGEISILAFSIGGTIAWKYGLKSEKIESLICVSSTRLRKETTKPKGEIILYYGEDDLYKPGPNWFDEMKLHHEIIPAKGHFVYQDSELAERVCKKVLELM